MNFEYCLVQESLDSIDIEDIGKCTLQVNNDLCEEWFLDIKTNLGWTVIQIFGPLKIGENNIQHSFNYSYNEIEFSQKKIHSYIRQFLNNEKWCITQAQIIDEETFNNRLKSLRFKDDSYK